MAVLLAQHDVFEDFGESAHLFAAPGDVVGAARGEGSRRVLVVQHLPQDGLHDAVLLPVDQRLILFIGLTHVLVRHFFLLVDHLAEPPHLLGCLLQGSPQEDLVGHWVFELKLDVAAAWSFHEG